MPAMPGRTRTYTYAVKIEPAEEGGFNGFVPALPSLRAAIERAGRRASCFGGDWATQDSNL